MRTMGTIEQIAAKHCGSRQAQVGAGEGGDLDLAADGADLLRQLGELTSVTNSSVLAERAEEVVVVGGDDGARVEPGQDPPPVVVGEAAAGDAGEEDVDPALADRLVDQVGAALVVEAQAGDGDRDAPDLAAAVGAGGERVEVLAGQFAVVGDGEAEQQLRVDAGGEADLERAQLVGPVGLDHDRPLGQAVQRHQVQQRVRAVGLAADAPGDRRGVDGVVEVGVADEHADGLARRAAKRSSAAGSGSVGRRSSRSRKGTRER